MLFAANRVPRTSNLGQLLPHAMDHPANDGDTPHTRFPSSSNTGQRGESFNLNAHSHFGYPEANGGTAGLSGNAQKSNTVAAVDDIVTSSSPGFFANPSSVETSRTGLVCE